MHVLNRALKTLVVTMCSV